MSPSRHGGSLAGGLTRLGFTDPTRALTLLSDPVIAPLVDSREEIESGGLAQALSAVADPDQAALALVRIMEAVGHEGLTDDVVWAIRQLPAFRTRLLHLLGASLALGDQLVRHPEQWVSIKDAEAGVDVQARVADLVAAVQNPGDLTGEEALRVAYRRHLLAIAALDVTAPDPTDALVPTAAALADLAQAALEAALVLAQIRLGEKAKRARLAVIGMGKTGGRELNYISDVDVIFVVEPAEGVSEDEAIAVGTELATSLMRICSLATPEGSLWQVDPALRPEGKHGPLVRTVASHRAYYERWAKTWEFQALLKARPLAGDAQVGASYLEVVRPMVWEASSRPDFVDDVQAMRRRVEDNVPAGEADRQIKLGKGGLRDVEFSVQLLQLVHGRADETLRSGSTLEALSALSEGGYVGRDDAAALGTAYLLLRTLEHRIQLQRMRRTHLMPTAAPDLRRLGRSLGHRTDPGDDVLKQWRAQAREVRRLHERIFYRPLLSAVAKLSTADVRLTPAAAQERLSALGFRDPKGALRHLEALTDGVSRRAAIQRQLLPVMLGWFADEADPDFGLLAFRKVSDSLGTTPWYLRLLRDEGSAAEQLAHTLARSRFAADLLQQAPESVQIFGDSKGLQPRSREDIERRMRSAASRQTGVEEKVRAARTIRRAELFRVAVADLSGQLTLEQLGDALTDLVGALMDVTLECCVRAIAGEEPLTRVLVVGMGRLGGHEIGYGSDADVMFVHDPYEGAPEADAQHQAGEIVREFVRILRLPGPDPRLDVDATLRPEGKKGPIVRSLGAYAAYYGRWSLVWEAQALVRATPLAGDDEVGERFLALIDPLRWSAQGLSAIQVREIRTLKARMEGERLPRGGDRRTHYKLGHGGLSDVEWCAQLLQLRHAHAHPELRTTSTLAALSAAADLELISATDAETLTAAWRLASRMRNAGVLLRGRSMDSLPADYREAGGVARILGLSVADGQELTERYRRMTRRARAAFERVFYDD